MAFGFMLLCIGKLGLSISLLKIYDEFGEMLFLISGVLCIVGIVVLVMDFASAIMLYFACDLVIKKS